jgi:methyl-accepting chemotaxis protein
MRNLSIITKLLISFSIFVFMTILLGFFSFRGIILLDQDFNHIGSESIPSINAINNMQEAFIEIETLQQNYLFNATLLMEKKVANSGCNNCHAGIENNFDQNSLLSSIEKEKEILNTNWSDYKKIIRDSAKTSSSSQALFYDMDEFRNSLNQLMEIAKNNSSDGSNFDELHTISKQIEPIKERINDALKILSGLNVQNTKKSLNESIETISSIKLVTILIIVSVIIISIFIGLYLSIKVIREPLKNLVLIFELVAKGDLRSRAEVKSRDEFGILAEKVNFMIDSRKNEVNELISKSGILNKSSDNLLEISNLLASSSEGLVNQTNTSASSSEQVSADVGTVSTATEEMSSSIKEISKNTATASIISNEAQKKANDANVVMGRLNASSNEIGSILKVISSIAEQTNLLALNATIEAARSGEYGKGFAVVANEVKELAKESAKATEDISQRIKMIQEESDKTMTVIKEITEITRQVNDITNSIASAVEQQTVTVSEVNRNLSDASLGVASIAEVNSGISSSVNEFSDSAHKLKYAASELKLISKSLEEELINNYKL